MPVIEQLRAQEILDSRGRPTVKCYCVLRGGVHASASVPSGASTGAAEAAELRDGDPRRYRGFGCRRAVANVGGEIYAALVGHAFETQEQLDSALVSLDGTANKSRLGANAILSVSISFARAAAAARNVPLYQHFADMQRQPARRLPRPAINLFSGGKHAGGQVGIQDILIIPASTATMDDSLGMAFAVYQSAAELVASRYGQRLLRADEGGLAPPAPNSPALLADAVDAIEKVGLKPGKDVCLAVDVAASHFHREGRYALDGWDRSSGEMIQLLTDWMQAWPIVSIEDGLAEDDWSHWPQLCAALGERALVMGDDFLCTNPGRIQRALASNSANSLLLKVNQIGTLTEAAAALALARGGHWQVMVSARSGETEDDWLADLAVGWGGDQIKIGSITQSERLAKYNRLLEIESETGWPINTWPAAPIPPVASCSQS
jgi:enolase